MSQKNISDDKRSTDMTKKRPGISNLFSMTLYLVVILGAVFMVLDVSMPIIENMKDTASVQTAENNLLNLNEKIRQTANNPKYEARSYNFEFNQGSYQFKNNSVIYQIKTNSEIVTPHRSIRKGDLILSANAVTEVYQSSIKNKSCYMIENQYIKACINKIGGPNKTKPLNNSNLLLYYYNKNLKKTLNATLNIKINQRADTARGYGFTEAEKLGKSQGEGKVRAKLNSKSGFNYTIEFSLTSGSDFLQVEVSQ